MATKYQYDPNKVTKDAQVIAAQMNKAVDTQYAPQISSYKQQITDTPNTYNPYRNSAELQSRMDAKTLSEQMANLGLSRSGTNLTQQTALQTAKQKTLSSINDAEMKATQELKSQLAAYIAQRDAAKQTNIANMNQAAYNSNNNFNMQMTAADVNNQYAKQNLELQNKYNQQSAAASNAYAIQQQNNSLANQKNLANYYTSLGLNANGTAKSNTAVAEQAKALGSEYKNKINSTKLSANPFTASTAAINLMNQYGNDSTSLMAAFNSAGLSSWINDKYTVVAIQDAGSKTDTSSASLAGLNIRSQIDSGSMSEKDGYSELSKKFSGNQLKMALAGAGLTSYIK